MQRIIVIGWLVLLIIFGGVLGWTLANLPESKSAAIAAGIVFALAVVKAAVDIHPKLRAWNLGH